MIFLRTAAITASECEDLKSQDGMKVFGHWNHTLSPNVLCLQLMLMLYGNQIADGKYSYIASKCYFICLQAHGNISLGDSHLIFNKKGGNRCSKVLYHLSLKFCWAISCWQNTLENVNFNISLHRY